MKVSANWIREYLNFELPPTDELVTKIGAQLGGVEEVIDIGARYRGVVIVRVANVRKHEDSDHLNICLIDDKQVTTNVDREHSGLVQVVCGAPNVREGMLVAWLPPGSVVPSSYDEAEPFVLSARPLRGVVSNGMLASAKELGIGDSHEGLLELDPAEAQPGADFAETYKLNDVIIDVENKMFTHRPDCFGQLGVAREVAGILGQQFTSPSWYLNTNSLVTESGDTTMRLNLTNEIPELVPRYMLALMDNVQIKPSPVWLQTYLSRVGIRPINNIVDVTNYLMLLTGQPLHAFDYDKVAKDGEAHIVVRNPHADEELTLLDGKTIKPRSEAILIADQDKAIGLGGMMGGQNSEIDASTTRIIIECAAFDMYNIRRTSMEHGIFSDAVTRFTKGQSEWQCPAVLFQAVQMIQQLSESAKPIGRIIDEHQPNREYQPVTVETEFVNARLGLELDRDAMAQLLRNVECEVQTTDTGLVVKPPFWRTDIELREDIVEEVGRLYGYDQLPLDLPKRDITPSVQDGLLTLKARLRRELATAGANEVLTYSFVHGNLLDKVGQDKNLAFKLSNALSPDLQYYRLSISPSLLEKVHPNIKAGYDQFAIFEIGKAHVLGHDHEGLPHEFDRLALIFAADAKAAKQHAGAAYYAAQSYLKSVLRSVGIDEEVNFTTLDPDATDVATTYYEAGRSATVHLGEQVIGYIGEYSSGVRKALKLPDFCAGFEISLTALLELQRTDSRYVPLPRFPKVSQDITLRVPSDTSYQQVYDAVWLGITDNRPDQTYATLSPVAIYQSEDDRAHQNISLRLSIASYERTLTDTEVASLLDTAAGLANQALGAERV